MTMVMNMITIRINSTKNLRKRLILMMSWNITKKMMIHMVMTTDLVKDQTLTRIEEEEVKTKEPTIIEIITKRISKLLIGDKKVINLLILMLVDLNQLIPKLVKMLYKRLLIHSKEQVLLLLKTKKHKKALIKILVSNKIHPKKREKFKKTNRVLKSRLIMLINSQLVNRRIQRKLKMKS